MYRYLGTLSAAWCVLLLLSPSVFFCCCVGGSSADDDTHGHNADAGPEKRIGRRGGGGGGGSVDKKILSLPLIPHRVQKERRRLEMEGGGGGGLDDDEDHHPAAASATAAADRSHYPRRSNNNNNRHLASAAPDQVAGLFQGYGTHYADLWCGSPPQRQTVIVDTGSGVTAFPCSGCRDCGVPTYHIDELFVEADSGTFKKLACNECKRGRCSGGECHIGMSYQEGSSWSAYEGQDICYVGGLHRRPVGMEDDTTASGDDLDPFHAPSFSFGLKFGCQTSLTGLFKTQLADGIMGMDNADASFWKQMYEAGKITDQVFALCFSRQPTAARQGTVAGAMTLGGVDDRLHHDDMVYTSIGHSTGFYGVHLRAVYMREASGGESALSANPNAAVVKLKISENDLNLGQVIVDSGTTDTYFTRRIQSVFKDVWRQMTGGEEYSHNPVALSDEQLAAYPTIIFQLGGDNELNQQVVDANPDRSIVGLAGDIDPDHPLDVLLVMPPSHYFEYDDELEKYVARFYTDEGSGSVLGANAMMGHDVYFDVEQYKIGWAESTCDYKSLVQPFLKEHQNQKPPPPPPPSSSLDNQTRVEPADGEDDLPPGAQPLPGEEDAFGIEGGAGVGESVEREGGICSSLTCQVSLLTGMLATIVLVAVRVWTRSSGGPAYQLQTAGIELPTAPSSDDDDDNNMNVNDHHHPHAGVVDGDGEFIRYRDRPSPGSDNGEIVVTASSSYESDASSEREKRVIA